MSCWFQNFGNHITSYCKQCHFPLTLICMLRWMSQIHSHTDVLLHPRRMLCFCLYVSVCLSVHRITYKLSINFWLNFNRQLLINFVIVRYLANKKHSILMLISIAEFVAEVLPLQDKNSCKKPRFRAESVVLSEQLWTLASCCWRPVSRISVLEELNDNRFAVIQEVICCWAFWRWVTDEWLWLTSKRVAPVCQHQLTFSN